MPGGSVQLANQLGVIPGRAVEIGGKSTVLDGHFSKSVVEERFYKETDLQTLNA